MNITLTPVQLVLVLSLVVRYVVDVIGRPIVDYYKLPHALLAVVALLVGEALAFGVSAPLFSDGLTPIAARAVTGVILAGGGGLYHDIVKAIGGNRLKTPVLGR